MYTPCPYTHALYLDREFSRTGHKMSPRIPWPFSSLVLSTTISNDEPCRRLYHSNLALQPSMGDRNATCYWKYPAIPFPTLQPNNGSASPDVPIQTTYVTIVFGVSSILFAFISTSIIMAHALRDLNVVRYCGPIAVFFAFCWAFAPVVSIKTDVDGMQSTVVAVGAWSLIMIGSSMMRSTGGKTASVNYNSASVYFRLDLRVAMLDFYCLPPSEKMIAAFQVHGSNESIAQAISQGGERAVGVRANSSKTLIDPLPAVA
ncbi:hypothetical protein BC936DRAFT_146568 [Jimgerdemannia flammicorona]|uniref:Uncharacterized protein n=1 Tax=Jimgerdemannia flammicorona TaxID=994334 RepID=A0A433D7E4_9FUNG|nr:hypothetical protein BC936DRAFT_146568 [Jimgerdemannia flammicorona]